ISKAARGEGDVIEGTKGWQGREESPLLVECFSLFGSESPLFCKDGVERAGSVSLGQDESVALLHPCEPQKDEEFSAGKRASYVPGVGLLVHRKKALLHREGAPEKLVRWPTLSHKQCSRSNSARCQAGGRGLLITGRIVP